MRLSACHSQSHSVAFDRPPVIGGQVTVMNLHLRSIRMSTFIPFVTVSNTGENLLSAFNFSRFSSSALTLKLTRMFLYPFRTLLFTIGYSVQ